MIKTIFSFPFQKAARSTLILLVAFPPSPSSPLPALSSERVQELPRPLSQETRQLQRPLTSGRSLKQICGTPARTPKDRLSELGIKCNQKEHVALLTDPR